MAKRKRPKSIPDRPIDVNEIESYGLGYERVKVMQGSTYKDSSTIVIVPSREPMVHWRIVQAWQSLISPMNQKKYWIFMINDEVGTAYNNMIQFILDHPELSKWKYILTLESDNLVPPDTHIRLLETIDQGKYDGVSGIYHTKGDINMPMAYGDPAEYAKTGILDFNPRDIREALIKGHTMEVNGIAMGASLYRLDLFREVPKPWFVTVADVIPGQGIVGFTQDLWFCRHAREMGKRFAVDMRVRVGHLDLATGIVY